jgi:hypothetical protein
MSTIALYAGKINQMPWLISDVKKSVGEYKSELFSLKNKALSVNRSVCNLDEVISSIQTSTQTQEEKIAALESLSQHSETFISDVVRIDGDVADIINKNKDDFYNDYYYLKPDCEKGWLELIVDKACDWCSKHWKEILIGLAAIVIGAILTFLTGGAFLPALLAGLKAAIVAGLISGGICAGISITVSIVNGESFETTIMKAFDAFGDGFASGFMTGGLFAGGSQALSAVMNVSAKMGASATVAGKFKFWSPNSLDNPNLGGTLFKIGKTLRFDVEAGKQLFHTHLTKNIFEQLPKFLQSAKWLFEPSKRDVHMKLTELLGGLIGASVQKK